MTGTVVLFAGHRVDEPGRITPRFPAACEVRARRAIRSALLGIIAKDAVFGIAGAADGGDILFHEVCAEVGIASEVCLALPPEEYVHTSVQASWRERVYHLLKTHPSSTLEPGAGDLWLRDHEWQLRRARERHPSRTVLLALFENEERNIPGGTSGMLHLAQQTGLDVIVLDTLEICKIINL